MTDKQSFATGKRIRKYRKSSDLSQEELAKKAKLPTNTIARLERGEHSAKIDTLKKIAKVFNIKIDDLVGD